LLFPKNDRNFEEWWGNNWRKKKLPEKKLWSNKGQGAKE
jgi:hypothetical protein